MTCKGEFETLLLKTIDDSLKQVFGDNAAQIIYHYLDNNYSIKQEEIPEKLEAFTEGLAHFFGSGARVVENIILTNLNSKIDPKYKMKEGRNFTDYVNELKTRHCNQPRRQDT